MAGFFSPHKKASAISYFSASPKLQAEQYFYVTRRTVQNTDQKESLICVGGPDSLLPENTEYDENTDSSYTLYDEIKTFLSQYRSESLPEAFPYTWHGLMGYTHTRLRYI